MERFEITNSSARSGEVADIVAALKKVKALRVNTRRAFGWSNQPHVATFAAPDIETAKRICESAELHCSVSLIPYQYTNGKWKHNPITNTSEFIVNE